MSFKWKHLFNLFATLMSGIFLLTLGLSGIILAWSPRFQQVIMELLLEHPFSMSLICFGLTFGGGFLFLSPFLRKRKKYIHVSSGPYAVLLSDNVLHSYLTAYWEKVFPEQQVTSQFKIHKKSIEIIAEFPFIPLDQQKAVLQQIQVGIENILREQLGWTQEIHLGCSFKPQP